MCLHQPSILDLYRIIKNTDMRLETSKQHLHNTLFHLVETEVIDMSTFNDLLKLTLIDNLEEYRYDTNR